MASWISTSALSKSSRRKSPRGTASMALHRRAMIMNSCRPSGLRLVVFSEKSAMSCFSFCICRALPSGEFCRNIRYTTRMMNAGTPLPMFRMGSL